MVNSTEKILSTFAQMYFFKELVLLRKHSVDGMDINCLFYEDFQIVCRELMTPIEIVEYLKWRLEYYLNNGDVNFSIFMGDDDSVLFSRHASGEALVYQFLAERYGIKDAKEMEPFIVPFQWMLHNLPISRLNRQRQV